VLTLPEHTEFSFVFSVTRVADYLVFCVVFCLPLFVYLFLFICLLYCLNFFELWLLIITLAFSNIYEVRHIAKAFVDKL